MNVGTIVVLVLLVSVVFYVIGMYNALVAGRNRFKNAFAQIDVQLQRRYDLIPNLVEAAKQQHTIKEKFDAAADRKRFLLDGRK